MKATTFSFWNLAIGLALGVLLLTNPLSAQQVDQTVALSPGWNSVWLEVEPVNNAGQQMAPEDVFTNPSILAVATPKPLSGLSEFFASEPGEISTFNQDEWQQWKRTDPAGVNNLPLVSGNRPYLIQVDPSASPFSLTVHGKVSFFRPTWTPDRYNLVGFGLQGSPTFDAFFGPSGTRHPVDKIFSLNSATGNWQRVTGSSQMVSGQAYWVFCSGQSTYTGPVSVDFEFASAGVLNFGGPADAVVVDQGVDAMELDLKELLFSNAGSAPVTPELDLIVSNSTSGSLALHVVKPASDTLGFVRGNQVDSSAGAGGSSSLEETAAPQQTAVLTLGARRSWSDNSPRTNVYRLKTGPTGASFWLPVIAAKSDAPQAAVGSVSGVTGLWVGEVFVDQVTSIVEDGAPVKPASGAAPMRIILHSDANGIVRLLSQVTVMQSKTADVNMIPTHVLVLDSAKIPFFEGIKERNGKRVGQRIEAVAYDMPRKLDGVSQASLLEDPKFLKLTTLSPALQDALSTDPSVRTAAQNTLLASSSSLSAIAAAKLTIPSLLPGYLVSSTSRSPKLAEAYDLSLQMNGSMGGNLSGALVVDPYHRSNPFRHAYHHDLAKGPQITRTMNLVFDQNQAVAGRLVGTFSETMAGLIKSNLTLSGRFELRRVSTVDSLQ